MELSASKLGDNCGLAQSIDMVLEVITIRQVLLDSCALDTALFIIQEPRKRRQLHRTRSGMASSVVYRFAALHRRYQSRVWTRQGHRAERIASACLQNEASIVVSINHRLPAMRTLQQRPPGTSNWQDARGRHLSTTLGDEGKTKDQVKNTKKKSRPTLSVQCPI